MTLALNEPYQVSLVRIHASCVVSGEVGLERVLLQDFGVLWGAPGGGAAILDRRHLELRKFDGYRNSRMRKKWPR